MGWSCVSWKWIMLNTSQSAFDQIWDPIEIHHRDTFFKFSFWYFIIIGNANSSIPVTHEYFHLKMTYSIWIFAIHKTNCAEGGIEQSSVNRHFFVIGVELATPAQEVGSNEAESLINLKLIHYFRSLLFQHVLPTHIWNWFLWLISYRLISQTDYDFCYNFASSDHRLMRSALS